MPASSSSQRPRRVTLADVAQVSGVAVSTASRALSNPNRAHAQTVAHVRRVADELGYRVPGAPAPEPSGSTQTVAVVVADVTNPFYFDIIRGTQLQLRAAGYNQLLIDTEESDQLETSLLHGLRKNFDGAILTATRQTGSVLHELNAEIPLVVMNREEHGLPSVLIDTPSGMVHALAHLRSLGHESVVYAAGPRQSWVNLRRWEALDAAAQRTGVRLAMIGPFVPSRIAGVAAADELLTTGATACIAFNDLVAIGMLGRLRERGVRVPEDLSIVGCDDIFGADFCHPPLTTITAPIGQAARVAVSMLLARIDPRASAAARDHAVLPTHLTLRASTGPAPRAQVRGDAHPQPGG